LRHHKSSDVWTERKNRTWYETDDLCMEAADEIERLREDLRKIRGGFGDPISNLLPHEIAQAALKESE
jgi:hypothetical protein